MIFAWVRSPVDEHLEPQLFRDFIPASVRPRIAAEHVIGPGLAQSIAAGKNSFATLDNVAISCFPFGPPAEAD